MREIFSPTRESIIQLHVIETTCFFIYASYQEAFKNTLQLCTPCHLISIEGKHILLRTTVTSEDLCDLYLKSLSSSLFACNFGARISTNREGIIPKEDSYYMFPGDIISKRRVPK